MQLDVENSKIRLYFFAFYLCINSTRNSCCKYCCEWWVKALTTVYMRCKNLAMLGLWVMLTAVCNVSYGHDVCLLPIFQADCWVWLCLSSVIHSSFFSTIENTTHIFWLRSMPGPECSKHFHMIHGWNQHTTHYSIADFFYHLTMNTMGSVRLGSSERSQRWIFAWLGFLDQGRFWNCHNWFLDWE